MKQVSEVLNMDTVVEFLMAAVIEGARYSGVLQKVGVIPDLDQFTSGRPLRILLTGYNGARNTGADARVECMIRQFYHLLGKENVHIGVMTLDAAHSRTYYGPPTELIEFSSVFFHDLLKACSSYHLAVLCEGSCFKSKFANALTTFFVGASGIMRSQDKPVIAYGSEAGKMDWLLQEFVKRYCTEAYIISRTEPSMHISSQLGMSGELGTDTAWIFQAGPLQWAEAQLQAKGWDGHKPLVGAAVINPFYWPVRPDMHRYLTTTLRGQETDDHYDKWYFFSTGAERSRKFEAYIGAVAAAMDAFVDKYDVFPVIIGMERLDHPVNLELQRRMRHSPPIFCSVDYNAYEMGSVLWKLSMLVTSRYHARVQSMPAGVPSAAISMDERLENLLRETGHLDEYYIAAEDPAIGSKLLPMMEKLWENREQVGQELLRSVPPYLKKMAKMGQTFKRFIRRNYPGVILPPDPPDWLGYLPPLSPRLQDLVEQYA